MVQVTGLTKARMLLMEAATIVSGAIVGDDLILTKHDGSTVNAGNVRGPAGTAATGAYTPALTNMAIGTGGSASNSARYAFSGGPLIGDKGPLRIEGMFRFGTTGVTLPGTGVPGIGLPAGFEIADIVSVDIECGVWSHYDVGNWTTKHVLTTATVTRLNLVALEVNTTLSRVTLNGVTSTIPNTWANGDYITWAANLIGERV